MNEQILFAVFVFVPSFVLGMIPMKQKKVRTAGSYLRELIILVLVGALLYAAILVVGKGKFFAILFLFLLFGTLPLILFLLWFFVGAFSGQIASYIYRKAKSKKNSAR